MIEIGSAVDRATEQLAKAIAEQSKGRLPHLGLISEVIADLMCRIDAYRSAVLKKRRKAA
jgi:hypothetical protein